MSRGVVGGILSGSLALLADAGHMLTDASGPSLCAAGGSIFPSSPTVAPHFWLAKTHHTGGFVNAIALVVVPFSLSGKR
ncbi:cation transporter [Salmonella enterica subsp. enterica]|nr:cation transporter [Salmonella enterica subsp. enterica]